MATKNIYTVLSLRDNFSGPLKKAVSNTNDMKRALKTTSNQVKQFSKNSVDSFQQLAGKATKILGGIGVGISTGRFLHDTINTYADFQQSLANVSAVTGKTGDALKELEILARDMGKKTTKSASEAADAIYYMGLAGWDSEQIMEGLEPVLRLSEAGSMDLARASDLVTDSMSAMGITVDGLEPYLNKVSKASASANTDMDALMEAYLKVGGTLSNLKTPVDESATLLGILANRGEKGSEAGNSLSSILVNLTTGAGQAGKKMKELGLSAFDSQGNFKGITNVLRELNEKTKNMTEEQRNSAFAMIGGKTQVGTLTKLMDGLNNEYDELRKSIQDSDGALLDMANTMNNTIKGKISLFNSAMDELKLKIGEKLSPYIMKMIDWFAVAIPRAFDVCWKVASKTKNIMIKEFEKIKQTAIISFSSIQGVLIEHKPIIDSVIGFLKRFIPTFDEVKQFGVNCWEAMKPVMKWIAVTGVPLLVDGFMGILEKSKQVYNWVNDHWPLLEFVILTIVGALATYKAFTMAQVGALMVYNGVQLACTAITGGLSTAVGILNALFIASPIGWVCLAVGLLIAALVLLWKNFDTVKQVFSNMCGALKSGWHSFLNFFIGGINKAIDGLNSLFSFTIPDWVPGLGGKGMSLNIPKVPEFQMGTQYFTGGTARINEKGGEIVNLPNGSQVIPHQETKDLLTKANQSYEKQISKESGTQNSTTTQNITVNINGSQLSADDVIQVLVPKLKLAISNM